MNKKLKYCMISCVIVELIMIANSWIMALIRVTKPVEKAIEATTTYVIFPIMSFSIIMGIMYLLEEYSS